MAIIAFPNGLGATLGDALVTGKPAYTLFQQVYYVDSVTGDDNNAGKERKAPFATFATALTNSSDGDIIVFLATHTETLSAKVTIDVKLTLVGEGSSGGIPTVTFLSSIAADDMFQVSETVAFHNIKFPAATVSTTGFKISVDNGSQYFGLRGCYFQLGDNDTAGGLEMISSTPAGSDPAGSAIWSNNTWISVSETTTGTLRPGHAVRFTTGGGSASIFGPLIMNGNVFDGGVSGFEDGRAFNAGTANIPIEMNVENTSLLNGADMYLDSASTGYIVGITSDGSAIIDATG